MNRWFNYTYLIFHNLKLIHAISMNGYFCRYWFYILHWFYPHFPFRINKGFTWFIVTQYTGKWRKIQNYHVYIPRWANNTQYYGFLLLLLMYELICKVSDLNFVRNNCLRIWICVKNEIILHTISYLCKTYSHLGKTERGLKTLNITSEFNSHCIPLPN